MWLSSDERAAATQPFGFPQFFNVRDFGDADFISHLRHNISDPSEAVSELMIVEGKKTG